MAEMRPPIAPDIELLRIPRKEARGAPRRKRRGWGWLVMLAILAAIVWLVWPIVVPMIIRWRAPTVATGVVRREHAGASLELTTASGYVVARTKAAVSSKLSGRLVDLRVDVGSR